MKAIQYRQFGGPEVLEIADIPRPQPGKGEVLIRVAAVGLNYFEVLMRADRYVVTPQLPMVPGVEIAGTVEALGEGVTWPVAGMRVAVPMFAFGLGFGGCAEYVAIPAEAAVAVPDGLSLEAAVSLMIQGLTALHAVRRSLVAGKRVLVPAAAGGVGSLLLQLVKAGGAAEIIAAASTPEKRTLALSLGADAAIEYAQPDRLSLARPAIGDGVDLIFDFGGGELGATLPDLLSPGGELVFGAMGRLQLTAERVDQMMSKNQSLKGFALLPLLTPGNVPADLNELFDHALQGRIKMPKGGRYPFEAAAEAHRAMEARRTTGKVVLIP